MDELIERLRKIDFFAQVGSGIQLPLEGCDLVAVESWEAAVELRGSDLAADAFQEASGRLTRRLSRDFRQQYRQWNIIARTNRGRLESDVFPGVDQRIEALPGLQAIPHGPDFVKDSVRWDLIHLAAEQAYAALDEPWFYTWLVQVYEAGRFPCHWDEAWPDGKLWVY